MPPDHRMLAALPDSSSHWLHSYPAHLSQTWTLPSGRSLVVRPVRHDDGERELAFVSALSLKSRYQRWLSGGVNVFAQVLTIDAVSTGLRLSTACRVNF